MQRLTLFLILVLGMHTSPSIHAEAFQSAESISAVVKHFLLATGVANGQSAIDIGALDPRARLALCPLPLDVQNASAVSSSAHVLLHIRCPATNAAWSIYLPATIHSMQAVAVLARPAAINQALTAADIRMEIRDTAGLTGGWFSSPEQLLGMNVRLQLTPGLPIPLHAVSQPLAVRRGQVVTLMTDAEGLQVSMQGQAMSDATTGQPLRVKNLSSKRIVEGVVSAPGIVTLN